MGHDIYARRVDTAEQERQHAQFEARVRETDATDRQWLQEYARYSAAINVAYLRRSAFDENNVLIYQALGCTDLYAGCSGNGEARTFTKQQVTAAYESLSADAREYEFLRDVLTWMDEQKRDTVEIYFG